MTSHSGKTGKDFLGKGGGNTLASIFTSLQNPENKVPGENKVSEYVPMITIYSNSFRDTNETVGGVNIHFDRDGLGKTPAYNREYIEEHMRLRQGFFRIVSDDTVVVAPVVEEVVEEVVEPDVEETVEEPVEEDDEPVDVVDVLQEPVTKVAKKGRPKKDPEAEAPWTKKK